MVSRRIVTAVLADLVCVLVFATVGRASHGEGIGPAGVLITAWPFAVGWLVGWVIALMVPISRLRPWGALAAVVVWVPTVVLGMLLRAASGAGVQTSFVVVATVVLGVFLLGWRGVVALVQRVRRDTRADAQV